MTRSSTPLVSRETQAKIRVAKIKKTKYQVWRMLSRTGSFMHCRQDIDWYFGRLLVIIR